MDINKFLKYTILAGIFIVPFLFLPLFHLNTFFPFIVGKNFYFRIIVEIITICWMVLAIRDDRHFAKSSWVIKAVGVLLAVMALSTIFSENPYKSFWSNYERMEGYITLLHLGAYTLVSSAMLYKDRLWDKFWHGSIAMNIFMIFYAIFQINGKFPTFQGIRLEGTLGNSAYMGVYILIHIFLVILFLISRKKSQGPVDILQAMNVGTGLFLIFIVEKISRSQVPLDALAWKSLIALVVIFALAFFLQIKNARKSLSPWFRNISYGLVLLADLFFLFKTETRGSIIGVAIGLVVMCLMWAFYKSSKTPKILRISSIVALSLMVASAFLIGMNKDSQFVKKTEGLNRIAPFITLSPTKFKELIKTEGKSRLYAVWPMAWNGFKERPIFGWGQESFNYVFYKYYTPNMYDQETWFDRAHNVFLDWLIAGGLLGLLAYLSLFAFVLYYLFFKNHGDKVSLLERAGLKHEHHHDYADRVVIFALLLAYFIHNIFVFDNIASLILFFSMLAYINHTYGQDMSPKISLYIKRNKAVFNSVGVPTVLVAGVVIGIFLNFSPFVGAFDIVRAMSQQAGGIKENISIYKDLSNANFFGKYEMREQLATFATRAASANIPPDVKGEIFNLAYTELRDQLKEVPGDARYHYFMAVLLQSYGQYQDAIVEWKKSIELSPKKQFFYMNLASVYAQIRDEKNLADTLKSAYEIYPQNPQIATEYLRSIKDYDRLIPILQSMLIPDPRNLPLLGQLADAYAYSEQPDKAIATIQTIIEIAPESKTDLDKIVKQIRAGTYK